MTVTLTSPVPAGAVAVICVPLTTVTDVPSTVPNFTPVAPVKFSPVIVTTVPPAVVPVVGEIVVTAGNGKYVKLSKATFSDVPPWFETRTSTAPVPAGEVAVIWVVLLIVKTLTLFEPKATVEADVKLVPVITTDDPPPFGPVVLESPVIVGGAK